MKKSLVAGGQMLEQSTTLSEKLGKDMPLNCACVKIGSSILVVGTLEEAIV